MKSSQGYPVKGTHLQYFGDVIFVFHWSEINFFFANYRKPLLLYTEIENYIYFKLPDLYEHNTYEDYVNGLMNIRKSEKCGPEVVIYANI